MMCGGSQGRQCSSEKTNRDSAASYYTDGQTVTAMGPRGALYKGECSNHVVFHVKRL